MRILNGVFTVLLILFVAVQYNDPDGPLWAAIYGVGAVWCAVSAFRARAYSSGAVFGLYALTLIAAVGGLYHYWPTTPHWWMEEVWWSTETAREGMGMMILLAALLIAGVVAVRHRRA